MGFEFKFGDAPKMTRSMEMARHDLRLENLCVVYPGERSYELGGGTRVVPIAKLQLREALGARRAR